MNEMIDSQPASVQTSGKAIHQLDTTVIDTLQRGGYTVAVPLNVLLDVLSIDQIIALFVNTIDELQIIIDALKHGATYTMDTNERFNQAYGLGYITETMKKNLSPAQLKVLANTNDKFKQIVEERAAIISGRLNIDRLDVSRKINIMFRTKII